MTGADRSIRVLAVGLLDTVQDLGRPGFGRFGVSPGGAADRAALILGNRLVGNPPGEAALEVTLVGPRLEFTAPSVAVVAGADLGTTLDGLPLPRWEPVAVPAGGVVAFGRGDGHGARAYVCVAGGITVPPVMGSRSTDLVGRFGGLGGRPLRVGADVPLGTPTAPPERALSRRLSDPPPVYGYPVTVRVVLGPQEDRFTQEGVAAFLHGTYAVSSRSDRMGVRLSGPPVAHTAGADLVSEGIAAGAVQVPGDGQPIVALVARHTVGGYPKVATAIGADLDRLGQLRPGGTLAFAAVSPEVARAETLAYLAALGDAAVQDRPRAGRGWSAGGEREGGVAEGRETAGGGWDPAGVVRVVEALRDAGVTAFRLDVAEAGLSLELRRGAGGDLAPPPAEATAPSGAGEPGGDDADLVLAPVLGVFYRRAAPDRPPLAEVGAQVAAGQAIGVLEMMKTYHEVPAPRAGTVAAFLVEDGQFVEYGAPIARLAPTTGS